ncbi:MAG TPA: lipid ABC transporter permease/ATP-binding protein, partial [Rhodanobacter sp.]|nr:lipid ABC transporter permease/ATP-binding protein [Rhodanobacter sp.]
MNRTKFGVWDTQSRAVYKRLFGYTRRFWAMAVIALIGMAVEGGGLAVFTRLLKPMIDQMFAQKNAYYIFWMPIWIIVIFVVRALG